MPSNRAPSVILTYHSLDNTGRLFSTRPETFKMQIARLLEGGLRPVPLNRVRTVEGSVSFTFDDGHRNFLEHALPVLVEHRIPATLFVVSGYCGRTKGWRSIQAAHPTADGLLSWSEVREIAEAGIEIGAHTVQHPSLISLTDREATQEMRASRVEIEDRIGKPVPWFAYPYGHSNPRIRELAAGEFQLACGTGLALVNQRSDPFDLPRIFEFFLRSPFWLRKLKRPEGKAYIAARRCLAGARTVFAHRHSEK